MVRMNWRARTAAVGVASMLVVAGGCAGPATTSDAAFDAAANAHPVSGVRPPAAVPSPGNTVLASDHSPAATPVSTPAPVVDAFSDMPAPPKDARYTIHCQDYTGPDHQDVARQVRDLLRANTSLRKWYVVHGNQQSSLYYGFYRTTDKRDPADADEGERFVADLDAVRTLHDSRGNRLFAASLPVPIDSPDPSANPAWDITRSGGYWSLEVGVFKDTADRKQRAVEAVAGFRKLGADAYYYHGPHASSVCIGAWPKAAAAEVGTDVQNVDASRPLIVTPQPLTEKYKQGLGDGVQTAAPRVDPVDPSMVAAIQTYQEHWVNGASLHKVDPATGQPTDVLIEHPFLFVIPASTEASLPTLDTASAASPTDAAVQPAAPDKGLGQLKGLDN